MLCISDLHLGHVTPEDQDVVCRVATSGDRLVVIAGDLTRNGRSDEFGHAMDFLGRLRASGCTIVATPGNHDLVGEGYDRFRALQGWLASQPAVIAHLGTDMVVRVGDDVVAAVRSFHSKGCRVRHYQIERLEAVLGRPELYHLRKHLLTHASLWDDPRHSPMRKRRRLEEQLLAPFGFYSVIHGHNHRFTWNPDARTPHLGLPIRHLALPNLSWTRGTPNRAFVRWEPCAEPTMTRGWEA